MGHRGGGNLAGQPGIFSVLTVLGAAILKGSLALTGAFTPSSTAGTIGTTLADNANAGSVGEYQTSTTGNTTATVTISNASPGIITWASHGLKAGSAVNFTTGGGLPTGLVVGTTYYVSAGVNLLAGSFAVSTTVANAFAGTSINTSSSGSGVHTGIANAVLATGTSLDILGIQLTAGDWDVDAVVCYKYAATTSRTNLAGGISTTTGTLGAQDTVFDYETPAAIPTATKDETWVTPFARVNVSVTTTVFVVAQATFSAAGLNAYGTIRARRVR